MKQLKLKMSFLSNLILKLRNKSRYGTYCNKIKSLKSKWIFKSIMKLYLAINFIYGYSIADYFEKINAISEIVSVSGVESNQTERALYTIEIEPKSFGSIDQCEKEQRSK